MVGIARRPLQVKSIVRWRLFGHIGHRGVEETHPSKVAALQAMAAYVQQHMPGSQMYLCPLEAIDRDISMYSLGNVDRELFLKTVKTEV